MGGVFTPSRWEVAVGLLRRSIFLRMIEMNDGRLGRTGASEGCHCDSEMILAPVMSISKGMLSGSRNARTRRKWLASGYCRSRSSSWYANVAATDLCSYSDKLFSQLISLKASVSQGIQRRYCTETYINLTLTLIQIQHIIHRAPGLLHIRCSV